MISFTLCPVYSRLVRGYLVFKRSDPHTRLSFRDVWRNSTPNIFFHIFQIQFLICIFTSNNCSMCETNMIDMLHDLLFLPDFALALYNKYYYGNVGNDFKFSTAILITKSGLLYGKAILVFLGTFWFILGLKINVRQLVLAELLRNYLYTNKSRLIKWNY